MKLNDFKKGKKYELTYILDNQKLTELKEMFNLEKIAGKGNEFSKVCRLSNYFSPKFKHSLPDKKIKDTILLIEYGLNGGGMLCIQKAKILEEMCLSLGILARRIFMFPLDKNDTENHVVTEIFDNKLNKWLMVDLTTNGYIVDKEKPLSMLEFRKAVQQSKFFTFVSCKDKKVNEKKYVEVNEYYKKNVGYFVIDQVSQYGDCDKKLYLIPKYYDIRGVEKNRAKLRKQDTTKIENRVYDLVDEKYL